MRRRIGIGVAIVGLLLGLGLWWRGDHPRRPTASAGRAPAASARRSPDFAPAVRTQSTLLAPRGTLSGRITEPAGRPVPGALVCADGYGPDLSAAEIRDPVCTPAGADGSYRLGNLYAAVWTVSASAAGHRPGRFREAKQETLDLQPGQHRTGIDLILHPGGVEARGRVKDIGGGVVAGAIVLVSQANGGWDGPGAVTRSDEKGEWRAWVSPGRVRATARAPGYAPGSHDGMAPGSFIEVLLTPESVLVGRVVEAGSDTPVVGALVVPGKIAAGFGSMGEGASALSDGEGRFRIERLEPGRYKPLAQSASRRGQARESVVLGVGERSPELVIEVHPAVTVLGKVLVAGSEQPCREGWVVLSESQSEQVSELIRHDGSVELRGLAPGKYQVQVVCKEHTSEDRYPPLVLTDRPLPVQTWHVKPGLHIAGTVVDADGAAVKGGSVYASLTGAAPRSQQSGAYEEIRPDGSFELSGLLSGSYLLRVSPKGEPEPKEPIQVALAGRSVDGLKVVLDRAGSVKGTVVDEHGQPVAGVEVQASGETWAWSDGVMSRDDGGFVIEGLRPGSYRVSANRAGWGEELKAPGSGDDDVQGTRLAVRAGAATPVKLVVERQSGRITGTVSRGGKPVTDAFVDAQRESESAAAAEGEARRHMRWAWARQPVLTDADGRFTLTKLAPGKYLVRAYRKGGGEAVAEHVEVGTAVALAIKPTGTLKGTVVVAGQPPPDQFSVAVVDDAQGIEVRESFWRTGGVWALRELPAGEYKLSAAAHEGEAQQAAALAEGQTREGLRLELRPRALLRGQLLALDDGKPVPRMRVMAQLPSSGGTFYSDRDPSGERKNITDLEGRFQIDDAPVGRILVVAYAVDYDASDFDFCMGRTSLQAGQTLELPPIRCARRRLKGSRETGGDLGFTLKHVNPAAFADPVPLVVAVVRPGGPAALAGLKAKDVVTSLDGQDLTGGHEYLFWTLSQVPVGTTVAVGVAGRTPLSITAGPQP